MKTNIEKSNQNRTGFKLIELLVAILTIAAIVLLIIPELTTARGEVIIHAKTIYDKLV